MLHWVNAFLLGPLFLVVVWMSAAFLVSALWISHSLVSALLWALLLGSCRWKAAAVLVNRRGGVVVALSQQWAFLLSGLWVLIGAM
jgi:hypothetical protein